MGAITERDSQGYEGGRAGSCAVCSGGHPWRSALLKVPAYYVPSAGQHLTSTTSLLENMMESLS